MVRHHEPLTVDLLVHIRHEVIELGGPAILHSSATDWATALLTGKAIHSQTKAVEISVSVLRRFMVSLPAGMH